jgi:CRISPR-associated protein Cas5t
MGERTVLGLYVTVPVACFRKGHAREYLETQSIPSPSTCYGFLLSLVGETNRKRHLGCRVTVGRFGEPDISVVLRTVWRVKSKPLGSAGNSRPDYQQLLTDVRLILWLDSTDEVRREHNLEERVRNALTDSSGIARFGGLSLGESSHLVDEVSLLENVNTPATTFSAFLLEENGRMTLPVWVDHVGSAETRYATGNVKPASPNAPAREMIPQISDI